VPADGHSIGEIVVRGDGVMEGYWRQPEATAEVMRGGWFHTGDMATLNEDGYFLIVDRKKDIIVSGEKISRHSNSKRPFWPTPPFWKPVLFRCLMRNWGRSPKGA